LSLFLSSPLRFVVLLRFSKTPTPPPLCATPFFFFCLSGQKNTLPFHTMSFPRFKCGGCFCRTSLRLKSYPQEVKSLSPLMRSSPLIWSSFLSLYTAIVHPFMHSHPPIQDSSGSHSRHPPPFLWPPPPTPSFFGLFRRLLFHPFFPPLRTCACPVLNAHFVSPPHFSFPSDPLLPF